MARLDVNDLLLTEDGDLVLDEERDLALASGVTYVAQQVYCRLKSVASDWFYDYVGADLEKFLGYPNTRETAEALSEKVKETLTQDGLLEPQELFIKPVPLDREMITLFVFIKVAENSEPICFQVNVDLEGRVSVTRPAPEVR